jgi:hypothetical protein
MGADRAITRVNDGVGRRQFTPLRGMLIASRPARPCLGVSAEQRTPLRGMAREIAV